MIARTETERSISACGQGVIVSRDTVGDCVLREIGLSLLHAVNTECCVDIDR